MYARCCYEGLEIGDFLGLDGWGGRDDEEGTMWMG